MATHISGCGPDLVSSWDCWHGNWFVNKMYAKSGNDDIVFKIQQLAQLLFGLCLCNAGQCMDYLWATKVLSVFEVSGPSVSELCSPELDQTNIPVGIVF